MKWLDITRPGSKHSFAYLTNFFKKHSHWPKQRTIIEKLNRQYQAPITLKKF